MSSTCVEAHRDADQALRMPAAWRCASVRRPCEVLAGWVMVVLVSPRLAVMRADARAVDHVEGVARAPPRAPSPRDDRTTPPRRPAATAGHRQRVLRMRRQARVVDARRPPAASRASCASASARALCACMRMPSVSRPLSTTQALNGDSAMPARAHHRHELSLIELSRAADRAGHHAALAVEVLGARVDDEVGAELDRPLQRRRAEAVVDRQQRAGVVRDVGQRADVADLGQRIGRRLGEQQLRVRPHRRLPFGDVGLRDEGGLDAELGELAAEQH